MKPPFVVEADRGQRGEVVEIRVAVARFFQELLRFLQLAVLHLQLDLMNLEVVQQVPRSIGAVLLLERRPGRADVLQWLERGERRDQLLAGHVLILLHSAPSDWLSRPVTSSIARRINGVRLFS